MRFLAAAAVCAVAFSASSARAANFTVYDSAQLDAALKRAAGGDTIRIAAGNYGSFEIKNFNPRSAVTIVAASSANLPVFSHLRVTGSSNLLLTRLAIASPLPEPGMALYSTEIMRSHDVRLSGMTFRGVTGGGVANDPRGLRLSDSTNITVANNSFTELSHAIIADGSTRMTITDNGFTGIRTDGIMVDGASGSLIARNRFSDFRPEPGDHPDAIQLFNTGNATRNMTIQDNLMIGGAGQMQGIFMTNASGDRAQLDQIKIANNLMWGTMWNGIAAFTANRVTVMGNTLFSNAQNDTPKTWVRLEDINLGIVSGNYAGGYLYTGLGKLTGGGNVLSLSDVAALAAVARWDATHAASGLALPFDDIQDFFDRDDLAMQTTTMRSVSGLEQAVFAAVPEPASWALTIFGFGMIGGGMRRRLHPTAARTIQTA